jgi:RimJ/RimL family protein N-acetyltransferase
VLPAYSSTTSEWYEKAIRDPSRLLLAIETLEKPCYIGNIGLTDIEHRSRNGRFWIYIGDRSQWGKGYAKDATLVLLNYSFAFLNLHRIYLEVLASNVRAIKIYKDCGFKEEGRLREHAYVDHKYEDMICMGILRTEFERFEL